MARLFSADLSRLPLARAHEPEIRTLASLELGLPDDYAVFHGVHWGREHKGATVYGEIDLIVMTFRRTPSASWQTPSPAAS
jgi:hypothetical protein